MFVEMELLPLSEQVHVLEDLVGRANELSI